MFNNHKTSVMQRTFIIILLALGSCLCSFAQDNLKINTLMDGRYRNNPNASETILVGDNKLKRIGVSLYHSLSVVNTPDFPGKVEALLAADTKSAIDREVVYRSGALYYGFYALPAVTKENKSVNRYIFYLNQDPMNGTQVILIYVEGSASPQQIKEKLINQ